MTIQKLLYLDAQSPLPIDLYLQTPGGEIMHAMAIERTMRLMKAPVNTYALYECNSGGALLLAAGTGKRRAFADAIIVVHGIVFDRKPMRELVERVQDSYSDFWRKRARLPESWLPLPLGSIHILPAKEALDYGLIDEIVSR